MATRKASASTTRRSTTKSATATTSARTTAVAEPVAETPEVEAPEASLVEVIRKKEFIGAVVEASGAKRATVKKVLEAALMELGERLNEGKELNLPPLGKLSVNRQKEMSNAHVMIVKLRRPKVMVANAQAEAETPDSDDAEAAEES